MRMFDFLFFFQNAMLGIGLAMDAFSVALANGLREPCMSRKKACGIAGVFAVFQGAMPMIGWICVRTIAQRFQTFEKAIPWIALALLLFIGGKMVIEAVRGEEETECAKVGCGSLFVQGVATSIDALSVGFTLSAYKWYVALVAVSLIATITFALCLIGVYIGEKVGKKFSGKATLFGGIILIVIGLEIFLTGIF